MKPVFPNSAWVTAPERLILKRGSWARTRLKVRYGLLVHPTRGPVLIDTGYTPETLTAEARTPLLRLYARVLRPKLQADQQPRAVLAALGFAPEDVRCIIVTHFHADHVSGLKQFPNARFITHGGAVARMQAQSNLRNIQHGVFRELLPDDFADRIIDIHSLPKTGAPGGLPDGHDLLGDGSTISVDFPGHADGHFGVVFGDGETSVLYATDVQWLLRAAREARLQPWPGRLISDDFAAWQRSTERLASYMAQGHKAILCHDPEDTAFDYPPKATKP